MNTSAAPLPLVPTNFVVPQKLATDEFRLRMLAVNDVVKDCNAVTQQSGQYSTRSHH